MKTDIVKPTPEQIAKWKKEHGEIYRLVAGGVTAYVRKVKIVDMLHAVSIGVTDMDLRMAQYIACWLGGDLSGKPTIGLLSANQHEHPFKGNGEAVKSLAEQTALSFKLLERSVEDVELTAEMVSVVEASGLSKERMAQIKSDGKLRKVIVHFGARPSEGEPDKREVVTALVSVPGLTEYANAQISSNNHYGRGISLINQCWITGDDRIRINTEEEIHWAAGLVGQSLFREYAVEVTKL